MMREYNYKTAAFDRTFDCYDYVDCFNYMNLHDYLKLCKHGYSKVTDHASREIRFGRLTRGEGLALVRFYEQKPLTYLDKFLEWLGITPSSMKFMINQNRNKRFWIQMEPGEWEFNGWSQMQDEDSSMYVGQKLPDIFKKNNRLEYDRDDNYITIGKGWP